MIPADLLDKLREKDPDLWEKIAETALSEYEYHDEEFNAWISNAITYTDLFGPAQEAWLQHCLQAAIRARDGWVCQITSFGLPVIANVYNRREYTTGRGDTEAEALGWAYLAAIEAIRP
jgi:hypothetical protein